jgi:hypothetical protein
VDVLGLGPGDKFATPEAAALDFGKTYNDNSIASGQEYGATIFKVVDENNVVSYKYTTPNVGKKGYTVKPSKGETKKSDRVAEVHTHGSYDAELDMTNDNSRLSDHKDGNNEFSDDDVARSKIQGKPSFVATPGGELKKFDPKVHGDRDYELISKDLPSDVNSPNRSNTIDSTPLPKNEPINTKKENSDD